MTKEKKFIFAIFFIYFISIILILFFSYDKTIKYSYSVMEYTNLIPQKVDVIERVGINQELATLIFYLIGFIYSILIGIYTLLNTQTKRRVLYSLATIILLSFVWGSLIPIGALLTFIFKITPIGFLGTNIIGTMLFINIFNKSNETLKNVSSQKFIVTAICASTAVLFFVSIPTGEWGRFTAETYWGLIIPSIVWQIIITLTIFISEKRIQPNLVKSNKKPELN